MKVILVIYCHIHGAGGQVDKAHGEVRHVSDLVGNICFWRQLFLLLAAQYISFMLYPTYLLLSFYKIISMEQMNRLTINKEEYMMKVVSYKLCMVK